MTIELLQKIKKELSEKVNDEFYEDIALEVFKSHINEIRKKDTNKLYVYIGTYLDDYNGNITKVDRNSQFATYRLYEDIELNSIIPVEIHECDYFEQRNRVLIGNIDKIRKEFIIKSLEEGQEYSCEELIRRRGI